MLAELAPFAVLAVVTVGLVLMFRHMASVKRQLGERPKELEAGAADYGYRPAPDRLESIVQELEAAPRFQNKNLHLTHLLAKEAPGGDRFILDYSASGRTGGSSDERGTMFVIRLDGERLPRFLFRRSEFKMPKLLVAGMEKLIRFRYPEFTQVPLEMVSPDLAQSLMFAESRDVGLQVLTHDVINALSRHDGWSVESTGWWLFAERDAHGGSSSKSVTTVIEELAEFEELAEAFTD